MPLVNVSRLKSPWNITVRIKCNGAYFEIFFNRVILRECDVPSYVNDWILSHLRLPEDRECFEISYLIEFSNFIDPWTASLGLDETQNTKHKTQKTERQKNENNR